MSQYTVSFFGHRVIADPLMIEQRLETLIRKLLKEKEYVEFLVGRDGEFDQLVSSVIRRCKRSVRDDNSAHVWVLPYLTADYRDNEDAYREYYDEIEICASSAGGHFKGAYQTRNREMVDRSNLIVFCRKRDERKGSGYDGQVLRNGRRDLQLRQGRLRRLSPQGRAANACSAGQLSSHHWVPLGIFFAENN